MIFAKFTYTNILYLVECEIFEVIKHLPMEVRVKTKKYYINIFSLGYLYIVSAAIYSVIETVSCFHLNEL